MLSYVSTLTPKQLELFKKIRLQISLSEKKTRIRLRPSLGYIPTSYPSLENFLASQGPVLSNHESLVNFNPKSTLFKRFCSQLIESPEILTSPDSIYGEDTPNMDQEKGNNIFKAPERGAESPIARETSWFVDNEIATAAWSGNVNKVKDLLSKGAIVNAPNSRGQTALYCACRQGHHEVVLELLKEKGIRVNGQVPEHGSTPLHGMPFW